MICKKKKSILIGDFNSFTFFLSNLYTFEKSFIVKKPLNHLQKLKAPLVDNPKTKISEHSSEKTIRKGEVEKKNQVWIKRLFDTTCPFQGQGFSSEMYFLCRSKRFLKKNTRWNKKGRGNTRWQSADRFFFPPVSITVLKKTDCKEVERAERCLCSDRGEKGWAITSLCTFARLLFLNDAGIHSADEW